MIKPLEWKDHQSGLWSISSTPLGQCSVQREGTQWGCWLAGQSDEDEPFALFETMIAAQAAAQADYAARITAAFDPAWLARMEALVTAADGLAEAVQRWMDMPSKCNSESPFCECAECQTSIVLYTALTTFRAAQESANG